jgi:hypothetical protein
LVIGAIIITAGAALYCFMMRVRVSAGDLMHQ